MGFGVWGWGFLGVLGFLGFRERNIRARLLLKIRNPLYPIALITPNHGFTTQAVNPLHCKLLPLSSAQTPRP